MDDHNHPHHHQQQQQPFMISTDLRRLLNGGRPLHFNQHVPAPPELFPPPQHYDLMHQMVGRPLGDLLPAAALHDFPAGPAADSITVQQPPPGPGGSTPRGSAFDCDSSGFGGDNGSGRWPRQETLTLLEIRSRLDSKFKEANQKGPLWDEVSRIMCDEHGFQRSGKKCREKFENLYKYYKKTKEGKAGRQDGKHYRFFRQLEALCGDTAAQPVSASLPEAYTPVMADDKDGAFIPTTFYNNTSNPNSLSLSAEAEPEPNSSDFESSSSDDSLSEKERKRIGSSSSGKSYWKGKIKGFIDEQMRKLVEKQEAWLEKLTTTLEKKEEERRLREEEWRRQEAVRMERERRFLARERGWIEARDTALVEALQSLTGKVVLPARASFPINVDHEEEEEEEEAAATPGNNGDDGDHHETDNATNCDARSGEGRKKRKGGYARSSTSGHNCNYGTNDHHRHHHHNQHDHQINERMHASDDHQGSVSAANEISCFPFLMGDGDQNFWENYGSLKMMNKGDN